MSEELVDIGALDSTVTLVLEHWYIESTMFSTTQLAIARPFRPPPVILQAKSAFPTLWTTSRKPWYNLLTTKPFDNMDL